MNGKTRKKIFSLIREKAQARPHDLSRELDISLVAIHKHLKRLVSENLIEKVGKPPLVFYRPVGMIKAPEIVLEPELLSAIEKSYMYIDPQGRILSGLTGFWQWCVQTGQEKNIKILAQRYVEARKEAYTRKTGREWINATDKIKATFTNTYVDTVLYGDFYSLPQFGKTRLGQLVLHAKQAQNRQIIDNLAKEMKPIIEKVIIHHHVKAVGFIPHSIPRVTPFLREFETQLKLSIPGITIVKAYAGQVPIAQKTLSKLEERVINARESIFIKDTKVAYKKVLLIDDAVGSGATLNETAKKLKQEHEVSNVVGFAIVGSMKGFDVIQAV